jgi:biopolymer transport protein TolR
VGASVGKKGRRRGGFADINVTPLVDVMLVLLIVFMVTAPLLSTSLRIELPEVQASNQPIKDAKLVISVDKDEHIFLSDQDVTANLEEVLKTNPRVQSEHEVYIRADRDARYRAVARAVAASRAAGVTSLNLLVEPEVSK